MWPTVINTAVGVRSISPEYLNVGRVLKLSRRKMLTRIIIPATLPASALPLYVRAFR